MPLIIPPVADRHVIINTLNRIDGLLLTGGADYNPLWAGEEPGQHLGGINAERDLPELLLTRLAYNRQTRLCWASVGAYRRWPWPWADG